MTYADYRAMKALSNTGMTYLRRSPAHYQAWRNGELDAEPTLSQQFGILVHLAILEPEKFETTCVTWNGDKRTKQGQELYEHWENQGKIIIKTTSWHRIKAIREAVLSHPIAQHLIESSQHEVIKTWTDSISGAECKCRADGVNNTFIIDLKTVLDASPEAMSRCVAHYEIHRQAAFYLDGFKKQEFFLIAAEKTAPHPVAVYRIPEHVISIGRDIYQPLAKVYQYCIDNDEWPAYPKEISDLHLPRWAIPTEAHTDFFDLVA
jgi:hypothetical protein